MSLINQMLKDLDARRVDAGGVNPFGEQVRAVPPRKRVHPAWWLALALTLVLAGVVSWTMLHPAPAAQRYAEGAQLPLRLALELGPIEAPAPAARTKESAVRDSAPTPEAERLFAHSEPAATDEVPRPAAAPVAAVRQPAPTAEVPAPQKIAPGPADEPLAETVTTERRPAPPIVKQVREPTPQQLAENAYREAVRALQQGRKAEARRGFEQALRLDAKHADARQALIAVLLEDGESDEALRYARAGVELDARQVGWAMIVARLQLERADLSGALETLERARPHGAGRGDFLAFHAALLQRAGRHKEAVEQYAGALQRMPQNGLWWMGLGISLQAEQRNDEAREAFERAKDANTLSPELVAFVDQRLAQLK